MTYLVAVSQRVDKNNHRNEVRDMLDHRIVSFLKEVGAIALPVPNNLPLSSEDRGLSASLELFLKKTLPNAIVLTGGNDLGECKERDGTERLLLDYAEKSNLPVLGICRGMQLMASRAGATLSKVSGHAHSRHKLNGIISSEVNSYHNYAIKTCPKNYTVLAKTCDQSIEAIRHAWLPWEGWMWHPERECSFVREDIERARLILKLATENYT